MRIEQIEIFQLKIKLIKPFIISLGPLEYAENIIVVIKTDQGIIGFGECSPFMTINGESIDTCFIVGKYLATGLLGKNPLLHEECSLIMDNIIYGNTSIKSAFDIAMYDIAAQNSELPLYKYLNGRTKRQKLVTDYTVSLDEPNIMADDAQKIIENGFQIIKVKLGDTKKNDIERIRLIRERIGNKTQIRIDANQGWDVKTAISILTELERFNIEFCEEPIARWNFMELSKVKLKSPIPIMADESCCDHHDAKRLIQLKACDLFNVKLGKSSGIFKALKIIRLAEKVKMKMQIGGFLESRLGFTAATHLALLSDFVVYHDFDTPLMFLEDPVVDGIKYGDHGTITLPRKTGLGASISDKYLRGLKKIVVR